MTQFFSFDSVHIEYNGTPTLHNISFSLREGEILGIIGESGSGKSTIIKAIINILGNNARITQGKICFNGTNLLELNQQKMRKICGPKIGMIFQDCRSALCPVRSIGSQIHDTFSAHTHTSRSESDRMALELFQKFGFKDGKRILNSYPFELSGGMIQRVGIAMAMLLNPSLILADEPTSALDVSVQKQILKEIEFVRDSYNTAVILVSHNIGVIKSLADSVMVLKNGHIVEYGATQDIFGNPQQNYTKELIAAAPVLRRN